MRTAHRVMRRRQQAGQTLAEMALVMPLVLLLIFGVIGLARLANVNEALHNACREGARWAATPDVTTGELPAQSDVVNRVIQFAADDGITLTASQVAVSQTTTQTAAFADGISPTFSQVQITYAFSFIPALLTNLVPGITLQPHAEMRNENN